MRRLRRRSTRCLTRPPSARPRRRSAEPPRACRWCWPRRCTQAAGSASRTSPRCSRPRRRPTRMRGSRPSAPCSPRKQGWG
ncbi:MAG: hypothetical protein EXQ70_08565 [Solirubrobacterales bacterium]|nr:hypothetical protein [Solirubrobacterales bacterium]